MSRRFEDRRVLVTGAAKGIGRAAALRFAAEGARTALVEVAGDAPDGAAAAAGDDALALVADVSDEAALAAAVARADGAWGGLDVVVANAATQLTDRDDRPDRLDAEAWQRTVDVNLTGAF